MKEFDTIAAIATGTQEGGIAIVRISGKDALNVAGKIFRGKNGRSLDDIKTYTMRYGHIISRENGDIIDEVIVSYMKGPKSYTAEDVVEISCHGGMLVSSKILNEVLKNGARLAEPGEFTKRAFLNGRIDLTEAEAVMDIIRAKTDFAVKSAEMQSEGKVYKKIRDLKDKLVGVEASIEAAIDYPEEDIDETTVSEVRSSLDGLIGETQEVLDTADEGKILREGLNAVIIGKPNVGKSSLLNALLHENKAIVTNVPGTTRDVIEESLNIGGILVNLFDTAGIRETEDVVEKIGVEKSKSEIKKADIIFVTLDLNSKLTDEDRYILEYVKNKNCVILLNKSDLDVKLDLDEIKKYGKTMIYISAKNETGLDEIKKCIKDMFFKGEVKPDQIYITNSRHKEALFKAEESLKSAAKTIDDGYSLDMSSIDIKNALYSLGEIIGENVDEDILDEIFEKFCVGK